MCEHQLIMDEKRRRSKLIHQLPVGQWTQEVIPRTAYRTLCLLTAVLAFGLGLLVGIMLPLLLLPRGVHAIPVKNYRLTNISESNTVNVTERTKVNNSSHVVIFPRVSFVSSETQAVAGNNNGVIRSGVYWSNKVEEAIPFGYEEVDANSWRRFSRSTPIVKAEEGCGRMQNRLLTFEDGTRSCCRYRQNTDQIQGELFSFYLGRILGLRNLAPSSLSVVKFHDPQWDRIRPQLSLAQWGDGRAVVLTQFVPSLQPANIPSLLRTSVRRLHPTDVTLSSMSELVELAQWSDLVLFDYLTANLDRVVNNMYNLQWNPGMMDAPAHNLAKDSNTGLLLFLDNESGLLHGYRLLDKYEHYHVRMLEAVCVFRKDTADAIKRLHKDRNVGKLLQETFESLDQNFTDYLSGLPEKSIKILNDRIDRVYNQIKNCESQYS